MQIKTLFARHIYYIYLTKSSDKMGYDLATTVDESAIKLLASYQIIYGDKQRTKKV